MNCLNILSLLCKVLFNSRLKRSVVFVLALLPALSVQLELVSKRFSFEPSEYIIFTGQWHFYHVFCNYVFIIISLFITQNVSILNENTYKYYECAFKYEFSRSCNQKKKSFITIKYLKVGRGWWVSHMTNTRWNIAGAWETLFCIVRKLQNKKSHTLFSLKITL